ncbi:MAG: DoxX family membrane protein [Actinobacteria bacterium]|nr:DoxX family membrane protein [Actinomycetota bacterium]
MAVVLEIVFGAVFVASGFLKRNDPGWPQAALALGTPRWLVGPIPILEVVLGVAIISGVAPRFGLIGGCVVLAGFTVVLLRAIRMPEPPVCACFGQWSAKPIGTGSIVRNAVLLVVGIVALALTY